MIWADYYNRDRHSAGRNPTELRGSTARSAENLGTLVMNVNPAPLLPTRVHLAPEEAKAAALARAQLGETRVSEPRPHADHRAWRKPPRPRSGPRLIVAFALVVAGAGAVLLWQSPRLRAQLPATVRATLERGLALVKIRHPQTSARQSRKSLWLPGGGASAWAHGRGTEADLAVRRWRHQLTA